MNTPNSTVKELNKKYFVSDILLENLEDLELTDVQKSFIAHYRPEKSLIVYGTLAPGKPNHSKISFIRGKWLKASVIGSLANEGWGAVLGFPGFLQNESGEAIPAYVLVSDELASHWAFLDQFEGAGYRRILSAYTLQDGSTGVGYIYALNQSQAV